MKLNDVKHETHDIKGKFVLVRDAEITDQQMSHLAQQLKKGGAVEVVYVFGDIKVEALSDEDLANMRLQRIPSEGPKSK